MGVVTGIKCWVSLKYRIRDFAIKYSQQLRLNRAKVKSLEDRFSRAVEGDLEHKVSKRYKGFVVRNKLKRVSNKAVRCNAFMHEVELQRFPDGRGLQLNEMHEVFRAYFCDRFASVLTSQCRSFITI